MNVKILQKHLPVSLSLALHLLGAADLPKVMGSEQVGTKVLKLTASGSLIMRHKGQS